MQVIAHGVENHSSCGKSSFLKKTCGSCSFWTQQTPTQGCNAKFRCSLYATICPQPSVWPRSYQQYPFQNRSKVSSSLFVSRQTNSLTLSTAEEVTGHMKHVVAKLILSCDKCLSNVIEINCQCHQTRCGNWVKLILKCHKKNPAAGASCPRFQNAALLLDDSLASQIAIIIDVKITLVHNVVTTWRFFERSWKTIRLD